MYMVKRTWQVFSAAGKLQNMIMTVFVAFGATVATYVGQNRGAGRMDPGKVGGEMHTGHDISLECDRNGSRLFWRKIYDMAVYRSV